MSGEQQINTPTTVATEPMTRSGSSAEAISFDDLEAITETKSKPMVKEKVSDQKPDQEKPAKANKPAGKDSDAKKEKVEKVQDEVAPKEELDPTAPKSKVLKFKNGEADLDVPADAKVTVKVNGKDEVVDLQTIVNEFSGKTNWGRKYQELDTERKTFNHERDTINSNINEIHEMVVTQGKPIDGIAHLAEILGADGDKIVKQMREQIYEQFEEWSKLSPEQRREAQMLEDNATLKAKLNRRDALDAKSRETATLAKRVDDIKAHHNIDNARFTEIHETLKKSVAPEDLTPELVGAVSDNWNRMDTVDLVVKEIGLEAEFGKTAFKELMTEWNKDRSLTKAQIKAIAEQVYGGQKPASKLADKIRKSNAESNAPVTAKKTGFKEENFFDDID